MISADDLEHAAAAGWRAAEEERLGGWLLRAAGGFTGRANSALAAGDPGIPPGEAIDAVRRWYSRRGLPPMIAVPYPAGRPDASPLDAQLAGLGWTVRADAATVMTADPAQVAAAGAGFAAAAAVDFSGGPDQAWLARYHYRGQDLPPAALGLLTSAPWQEFAAVRSGCRAIAIGRVAGDDGGWWAGLTAIEVDERHRRQGLGIAVTAALAARAAARGGAGLYLQVADRNRGARALYGRLGFAVHHGYRYRVAPGFGAAG